ncbi:lysophosphatidic acid acyltransferase [Thecamonas trahens ATCC 50062]|uniref:Lysophosphatidic acid acyltransferase n=1 Tax=Thecamonas trahens ATCC 50062 TaxID=461836 RepID=A0A0L0D1I7_THETB|nr:lysophosphatidic acid acyltransferase [Thecamonas trahens ATCC 50062]KNC46066.1 lysophosphatidic acid acyltransferase [Thecamonas trahens ATCC 50062]|eukprot:XP_013763046.1 lysophosphatidic acid acyltransferase [Thecamonas trahens ATCC 50062]
MAESPYPVPQHTLQQPLLPPAHGSGLPPAGASAPPPAAAGGSLGDFAIPISPSSENLLDLLERASAMAQMTAAPEESEPMWSFSHSAGDSDQVQQRFEKQFLSEFASQYSEDCSHYELTDPLPFVKHGMQNLLQDEFTLCFDSDRARPWNWNVYLFPMWLLGLVARYLILFPLRLLGVVLGFMVFLTLFTVATCLPTASMRAAGQRQAIRWLSFVFMMSWSGVIMFHGSRPARRANQIFVANHTSVIDVAVLMQDAYLYALVGQAHTGVLGLLQNYVLGCLGCIWFERSQAKDRAAVAATISEYIRDPTGNPLLLFPEGVCVNNKFVCMFKKGVFSMEGVEICPIAVRYNKALSDPFWNSRAESFVWHLLRLMTSWAVVANVTYLPPVRRKANETAVQFANSVKSSIARAAGLKDTPWDGFLKYVSPSPRFAEHQRQIYTRSLLLRFRISHVKRAASVARMASGESSPGSGRLPSPDPALGAAPIFLGYQRVPSPTRSPGPPQRRRVGSEPDPLSFSLSDVSDFSDDDNSMMTSGHSMAVYATPELEPRYLDLASQSASAAPLPVVAISSELAHRKTNVSPPRKSASGKSQPDKPQASVSGPELGPT